VSDTPASLTTSREVLRRLELDVTRKLDGLLQGRYMGLVPGLGSEPGEARQYQAGDDVRRIDWNVTARAQTPHVRETIADRELETWILVDRSKSLDFGTAAMEKRDLALAAVAAVGFLTSRLGNRVGAVLVDGNDRVREVPARAGRAHMQAIMARVNAETIDPGAVKNPASPGRRSKRSLEPTGQHGAGLAEGLQRLSSPAHRRGLAVVVSDLLDPGWHDTLRRVVVRHDTLVIEIIDPRELELPDVGVLTLIDTETGRVREVNTRSASLRSRYATAAAAQRADHEARIRAAGADHCVLRTDRDWLLDIVRFVALRRQRAQAVPVK
jgi:uncharacterized protein (DUF58 family)